MSSASIEDFKSQVAFLMETKLHSSRMKSSRRRCGFSCGIEVSSDGLSAIGIVLEGSL